MTSKLRRPADGFAPTRGATGQESAGVRGREPPAALLSVRPEELHRSFVTFARPTSLARRIPCGRHGDQRARRRPLRADRGGGRARGRRGATRHIRLAGADGTAAVARHPALHGHLPGHAGGGAAAPEVLEELGDMLSGSVLVAHSAPFDTRVLRQAFERCGLDWPAPPALCTVQMARRFAPLVGQARTGLARGLARHRRGGGPSRAARRAHVRARVLRSVPTAMRELGHGGRRARPARSHRRARKTEPQSASLPASGPISQRCPTTRGSTSSATNADGRSTWASRCRCAAAPAPISAPRRAGPRRPRSWTTGPRTPSSARSCWRTG